jgi:hypothetical protein
MDGASPHPRVSGREGWKTKATADPFGMTTRKATAKAEALPLGDYCGKVHKDSYAVTESQFIVGKDEAIH